MNNRVKVEGEMREERKEEKWKEGGGVGKK